MMAETVSVNLSGPALAFLLYENAKSKHEQEGFLLGDTNEIVTKTITDTDSHNVKMHKIININAVIPCPRTCLFYNNVGAVDREKLESILGKKTNTVIGWYLYEPHSNFKLTFRSKIVHRELCKLFSIPPELFTCCLLSSTKSHLESTFSYTHTFVRFCNKQFTTVPMHIDNLGESSNSYKPKIHASKSFLKLCASMKNPKRNPSDWQSIDNIQDKLHSEVTNTIKQLSLSEETRGQLEREVEQLRQQVEFQMSLLEEKKAIAEAEANAQNDNNSDNDFSLTDVVDINELLNDVKSKDSQETITNLSSDLSISNKTSPLNEKDEKLKKNISKNKVIGEITRIQKTNEEENILVDTTTPPSTSDDLSSTYVKTNVIDLTLTDEDIEEELNKSVPKRLSYSQVATASKCKTNTF